MTDDQSTRRRFLATLSGTAGVGALAGCPESGPDPTDTPTASPTRTGSETGTATGTRTAETPETEGTETGTSADPDVIDLVEAGASPNGDEPTVPVLDEIVDDGKTLFFPAGEYLLTREWRVKAFEDLTVVGDDATLRVQEGYDDYLFMLGNPDGARGLTVEGLEFDVSAPNTGARPIHGMVEDGLAVRNVTVTGRQDVDQDSVRFDVTSPEGTGIVERLELPDGGDPEYPITGCYVGEAHTGTLRFVDCHIAGFPDNGLYASPATGRVDVEGGRYENNDISNVRVSGPSTVRGVRVRCTEAPDGFVNMRGIRLREGRNVTVENCTVEMETVTASDGAITMSNWLDAATIRDTDVAIDADDVPAIVAKSPNDDVSGDDYQIRIENVTVSGTAAGAAAVRLLERDGCLVDEVCILQTGGARDGIQCTRVTDSTLSNSSIAVTGDPVVLEDASVNREGLETRRLGENAAVDGSTCG